VPLSDGLDTRPCKILDPPLEKYEVPTECMVVAGRSAHKLKQMWLR